MSQPPPWSPHVPASCRTWLELDASALRQNVGLARELAGPDGGVMAVVKADAYGLGVASVVPAMAEAGVDGFAVATLAEARELRAVGVSVPIFLLSPALPAEREAVAATDFPLIPVVSTDEEAADYNRLALAVGKRLPIHLVLDTGMGRIGFPAAEAASVVAHVKAVAALPGLRLDSVASHFPTADEDAAFTADQWRRYRRLLAAIADAGIRIDHHHVANSAGTLTLPRTGREWIRAGLMLFGVSPVAGHQPKLREIVTWNARVVLARTLPPGHGVSYGRTFITEKPTRVATLAVGYADGYPRHLSGQGAWVWLCGRKCPVLGRITMDQIMVEAPPDVHPGDVATILGGQGPSAIDLATRAGTIPYEIFCGLGRRVARP